MLFVLLNQLSNKYCHKIVTIQLTNEENKYYGDLRDNIISYLLLEKKIH